MRRAEAAPTPVQWYLSESDLPDELAPLGVRWVRRRGGRPKAGRRAELAVHCCWGAGVADSSLHPSSSCPCLLPHSPRIITTNTCTQNPSAGLRMGLRCVPGPCRVHHQHGARRRRHLPLLLPPPVAPRAAPARLPPAATLPCPAPCRARGAGAALCRHAPEVSRASLLHCPLPCTRLPPAGAPASPHHGSPFPWAMGPQEAGLVGPHALGRHHGGGDAGGRCKGGCEGAGDAGAAAPALACHETCLHCHKSAPPNCPPARRCTTTTASRRPGRWAEG